MSADSEANANSSRACSVHRPFILPDAWLPPRRRAPRGEAPGLPLQELELEVVFVHDQ